MDLDPLRIYTTLSLLIFLVLMVLALSRMIWRLVQFRRADQTTPYLLKRDVVLFGVFSLYLGLVLVFRLAGLVLTQNPFWVVPSTLIGLLALAYWVWVEFHLDD